MGYNFFFQYFAYCITSKMQDKSFQGIWLSNNNLKKRLFYSTKRRYVLIYSWLELVGFGNGQLHYLQIYLGLLTFWKFCTFKDITSQTKQGINYQTAESVMWPFAIHIPPTPFDVRRLLILNIVIVRFYLKNINN